MSVNLEVEIKGQSYALNKVPHKDSAIVLVEKDRLLGSINLKTLVDDLGRVGRFIRIAYNGVGAAGPKFTEEQIEIQRLGYDITKLCDKSALTVAKFKNTSSCILTNLQSTYDFLLGNKEELAIYTLSTVSELAGKMQQAALELCTEFEKQKDKVVKTLEDTQKRKGNEAIHIQCLKKEQIEMEEKKQKEFILMKEHQAKEKEAENRRRDLEEQEDKAMSEIGSINPLKELANVFTTVTMGRKVFSEKGPEKAEAIKKVRQEALETEKAIRERRHEALARMTSFTSKINQCQTEENMAECAVGALHEAIGALRKLSSVMMQAAFFWEKMQNHCKSLADSGMKKTVELALKLYSKKERLEVWTSDDFKQKAIEFYACWVALQGVCNDYEEQIKLTQKDLYRYIAENPSYEESRSNLEELTKKFLVDLKRDQQALSDKDFTAQEEIAALKEGKDTSGVGRGGLEPPPFKRQKLINSV